MRFLIDKQLSFRLAVLLDGLGHPSRHVDDLHLGAATDPDIWQHAAREGMTVVSRDEDFLHLALRPNDTGRLVWLRLGNCGTSVLLDRIRIALPGILASFESGKRVVELR